MIRIQPFEPRYRDGVAQLIVPIQRDEFDIAITYQQQTDLHDIAAAYQTGIGQFWIALTDDDRVVGSIALRDLGQGDASLHKMFVAADYRGAPHRVADRLLETLHDPCDRQKRERSISHYTASATMKNAPIAWCIAASRGRDQYVM